MLDTFAKIYYYQNFSIPSGFDSLDVLVWGMYIGVVLGTTFATVDKMCCERMVKALVRENAATPETAKTLRELDIRGKWYLKGALKVGKPLRKMLAAVDTALVKDTTEEAKGSVAIEDIPFYLPEENRHKAEIRYDAGRRPILTLILSILAMLAVVFFVRFAVPELLTMLDNFIGMTKGNV